MFWQMKDGNLIKVDDMDINHLKNTLKMIIRNHPNYCANCGYIIKNHKHRSLCPNSINNLRSFTLNGEIAQDMINEIDEEDWIDPELIHLLP